MSGGGSWSTGTIMSRHRLPRWTTSKRFVLGAWLMLPTEAAAAAAPPATAASALQAAAMHRRVPHADPRRIACHQGWSACLLLWPTHRIAGAAVLLCSCCQCSAGSGPAAWCRILAAYDLQCGPPLYRVLKHRLPAPLIKAVCNTLRAAMPLCGARTTISVCPGGAEQHRQR